jgi:hypothetical protein
VSLTDATDIHARATVRTARIGGWALIAAAIAFSAVFTWLAARFDYPAVLDGSADEVLPRLLALGAAGRAVWFLYGLLPLLLIPAGIGAHALLRRHAPGAARGALVTASVGAVVMLMGLMRWPSIHHGLAVAYAAAEDPAVRAGIGHLFDAMNVFLGNVLGEFVGELMLNGFFLCVAVGSRGLGGMPRWSTWAGAVAAAAGFVGLWRNVTPLVAGVSALDNSILPIWMLTLGVLMARQRLPLPEEGVERRDAYPSGGPSPE